MQSLKSIHHLRGIAAMGVLLFHAVAFVSGYGSQQLSPEQAVLGKAGVDIFFVISGFILTLVMGRAGGATEFMAGRLARVGLPYWSVLLALVAASIVVPGAFRDIGWDSSDLVASILFVPTVERYGALFPILEPGWTLCLEMFFYLLLAASLSLAPVFRSLALCTVLCGLAAAGLILDLPQGDGIVWFFTQSVLVEFCFGIAIAQIYLHGAEIGKRSALMLIALGLAGFVFGAFYPPDSFTPIRLVSFGIPAALLVAGAVFLERAGGWIESRTMTFLGTVSYSLYLTHVLVLAVMAKLLSGRFEGIGGDLLMLVLAMGAALVGAAVFYRLAEQPALWVAARLKKRRMLSSAAPGSISAEPAN
ncbi:MAG: acyltransferase family protein [Methyloligella sp. ZOD6]